MDCFGPGGYVQYHQDQIPSYWAYAQRFVLADRFFSSEYGPTCVEHFTTFAAGSDRFVDCARPGQFGVADRDYCDDPTETAWSFPLLTGDQKAQVFSAENDGATGADQVRGFFRLRWPCSNARVLPEELSVKGVSWREYESNSDWIQPLREVRQVRFSKLYDNVVPNTQFLTDLHGGDLPHVSWLKPPIALSDHPPYSMCLGENWTVDVVNRSCRAPTGTRRRVLTWEDPAAYVQRSVASAAYRFQARIVVHAPLREVQERTSVRSVVLTAVDDETTLLEAGSETLYGLAPLTARDANTSDMLSAFDFEHAPQPPFLRSTRSCPARRGADPGLPPAPGQRRRLSRQQPRTTSVW